MPINESTMQTALVSWVRAATGLAANRVFMADQDGFSPEELADDAFATLRLGSFIGRGPDEAALIDHSSDVPAPAAGEELERRVLAHGVMVVGLQLFTPGTVGASSALALARKCRTRLGLPSVHAALSAAGLAVSDPGTVLNVSARIETRWRGRAALDVRCNVLDDASERLGYIATATGTMNLQPSGASMPFTATIPP